ncbi:unnamed protein product, partial [Menidia menidia]
MPPKPVKGENSIQSHLRPGLRGESSTCAESSPGPGAAARAAAISDTSSLKQELLAALREDFTSVLKAEFHAVIGESLSSIKSELLSFKKELSSGLTAVQESFTGLNITVAGMEKSLSTCTDDIVSLRKTLDSLTKTAAQLEDKCDDLESWSRRQNIRIIGVPEDDPLSASTAVVSRLLKEAFGFAEEPLVDRAHRIPIPKPKAGERPRPIVAKLHYYTDCVKILSKARDLQRIKMNGRPEHELRGIEGVRFGLLHPARLRITHGGTTRVFTSPEEANIYIGMPPKPVKGGNSIQSHLRLGPRGESSTCAESSPGPGAAAHAAAISDTSSLKQELLAALREDFTAILKAYLSSIKSELLSFKKELSSGLTAVQESFTGLNVTVAEMEKSLSTCTDEIVSLRKTVDSLTKTVAQLEDKCDDLESRSRRQNIRIIGVPEDDPLSASTAAVSRLLKEAFGFAEEPLVDRAHRIPIPKPKAGERPCPIVAKLHYYTDCVKILSKARELHRIKMNGRPEHEQPLQTAVAGSVAFRGSGSACFIRPGCGLPIVELRKMPPKPVKGGNSIQSHLRLGPRGESSTCAESSPGPGAAAHAAAISDTSSLKQELLAALREDFTAILKAEFHAVLGESLSSIKSELLSFKKELSSGLTAVQESFTGLNVTVAEMEKSLSTCTDEIVSLRKTVDSLTKTVAQLEDKCDDLESRSRRRPEHEQPLQTAVAGSVAFRGSGSACFIRPGCGLPIVELRKFSPLRRRAISTS